LSLAVVALVGIGTASAQVQFFVAASGARQVRSEGITEAVGTVSFAANSTGTIKAGSTISLDYGAAVLVGAGSVSTSCGIASTSLVSAAVAAGGAGYVVGEVLTVVGGTFTTVATLTVTTIAAGVVTGVSITNAGAYSVLPVNPVATTASAAGVGATLNLTFNGVAPLVSAAGNIITLTYAADVLCSASNSIQFSGARVNANALGAGTSVNVGVGASVPAAFQVANPITLIQVGTLAVATVQPFPSTTTIFTGANLLLCNSAANLATGVNSIHTVTERFPAAFTTTAQETGLGTAGTGGTVGATRIRWAMTNIPVGVNVVMAITGGTTPGLTAVVNGSPFLSSAADRDNDFEARFDAGTTNTATIETLEVTFTYSVPTLSNLTTVEQTGTTTVRLRGTSTDIPNAPIFASINQATGTTIRVLACATYLLYTWTPWLPNTNPVAAVDTGISVSNTTKDPATIGTGGQTGDINLYFFKDDGTALPAVLLKAGVTAGETVTTTMSALAAAGKIPAGNFLGYMIAVTGFQMGHGLGFISNQGSPPGFWAQTYAANSITNPRLPAGLTESAGH
jgi:hypothetical protein